MERKMLVTVAMLSLIAFSGVVSACQQQALADVPSRTDVPVKMEARWTGSYETDIQPIFNEYCVSCHGAANAANGLRLDTYAGAIKGTQYGRVIMAGEPGGSTLLRILYVNADPQVHMPNGNLMLTKNRIENIRLWIQAGAPDN